MPNNNALPFKLFQALGDPTRLAVVERLFQKPETVTQLAAPFKMALPSFLQHLEVLEKSGWIHTSKAGRVRTCRIAPEALQASGLWLDRQRALWNKRLDQLEQFLVEQQAKEKKA